MSLYSEVYFVINRTSTCFGHHYAHHQENNIVYDCVKLNNCMKRALVEKLTGPKLVKNFPALYGIWKFITAITRARHLSLS